MFIVFVKTLIDCMPSQFRIVFRPKVAFGHFFLSTALSTSPSPFCSCPYAISPSHSLTYKDGSTITPSNVPHTPPWALSKKADRCLRTETPKRQTHKLKQKSAGIFEAHAPSELNLPKSKKAWTTQREAPRERIQMLLT